MELHVKGIFRIFFLSMMVCAFLPVSSQVDTEFWFAVPEISHRGSTGGKPGTMRFAALELETTVTIEMPANPAFTPIVIDIPANDDAAVDLSHLIDDASSPAITGLENKALTPDGINPFGLHITSTNRINAYWEVNYVYGADIWSLKGSNGLGTLFYTPFQKQYPNNLTAMPSYSAIDIVATQDNTTLEFTLPDGVGASFGEPMTVVNPTTPGTTFTIGPLDQGETFSLFPMLKSNAVADRLAGTRIESNLPITVSIKDDNLNTGSIGRSTIGDQIVPINIIGETYVVPSMGNPNLTFVVATEDNTNIYVNDVLFTTLNEGEQTKIQSPNNQFIVISSSTGASAPPGPSFYALHIALSNSTRATALLPPIGCTGNTQLAFTRAREATRENFYFFLITENENIGNFMIDGSPADPTIISNDITKWEQLGNGWSAFMTGNTPASKLSIGQHLVENTGGIFHLAVFNGFTSANLGDLLYGYFSDYGGLNVGAVVAGTNTDVIRACYGTPVQLHAYGGTIYEWTPQDYLDDPYSNLPFAINLPAGAHEYTANVGGSCGSGTVKLTVVVASPVSANFKTDVTSGCSPLTVHFEDQSAGNATWQYDMGDGITFYEYDTLSSTPLSGPPSPFEFTHTYENHTDSAINYEVTLLVKNSSACADIITRTITVFPEITSDFTIDQDNSCDPLVSSFTNQSSGDTATWWWEFGDGGSASESDPIHVYRNLFGPDAYVFDASLIAISPFNCRDTSIRSVTVKPYIEAMFTYDTVAECSPHDIILTDQSIGADNYQWDFGDGAISNSSDPVFTHLYVNTGTSPETYTIKLVVTNDDGCIDSIQRDVTIYPQVEADFSVDPNIVCSPADVAFTNLSTGPPGTVYVWDFGDGGSSNEESPVHRYDRNLLGYDTTFTVMLVAITDQDCRDTATMDVVIHPFIEAAFTVDDVVGCDPFEVSIQNESSGVDEYLWNFGDGVNSTSGAAVLNHVYNNTTNTKQVFPLQLIVSNTEGCRDTMMRNISVNPLITANFTFDRDEGCHPLNVNFSDLSESAEVYLWDFGDGAASTEHSPKHTFTNFGITDTTYTVTLSTSTSDGECVKSVSWDFTVHPNIRAEFTFPRAIDCGPFEVTFDNLTIGGTEYRWNFDDGNTFTTTNTTPVTHEFINTNSSGQQDFDVMLVAENFAGCRDTSVKTISVYPGIESEFSTSVTEGCQPLNVDFSDLSEGANTYIWDFGDGTYSNMDNPSHTFTNNGNIDSIYTVKLTTIASNNICSDSSELDITVNPYLQAKFSIPVKTGCNPFDAAVENSSVNAVRYYWDFGDGTDTITENLDPFGHRFYNIDFVNQEDYTITLTAENAAGCQSVLQRTVTVEPDINADFSVRKQEGCHPLKVDFLNNTEGGAYYEWNFGDGTTSSLQNPSKTFSNITNADITYRVWLYAFAPNNICADSTFFDILVHPYIAADFTFEEGIQCTPSTIELDNASVGGQTYYWNFGDGTDSVTTNLNAVSHQFTNSNFDNSQTYTVTLVMESFAGCVDSISKSIEVYPAIEANFTADVAEGCHPFEVNFSNMSRGGDYYKWNFSDGSTSNSDSPQHTFSNYTDTIITRQVQLSVSSAENCSHDYTAEIIVHPKPLARFDTDVLIDCPPFDVPLTNTSLNADIYTWNFGDDTDTTVNSLDLISHMYDNLSGDIVSYNLSMKATSNFGCVDSAQQKISVYPNTIADFTVNDAGCSPHNASFTNNSIRGATYKWDFGDGSIMTSKDPSNLYFNSSGRDTTFVVSLQSTSRNGCTNIMYDTISVFSQPEAIFTVDPVLLEFPASTVTINNLTSEGNWDYEWTLGDGSAIYQENPDPHSYSTWGDYEIQLTVRSSFCSDSSTRTVKILPATPIAEFDTVYAECAPLEVTFVNNSQFGDTYLWDFDDGSTSTEFEPFHVFENHGIYNVRISVTGPGGVENFYRPVEVYQNPIADFELAPDTAMLPSQETRFFNISKYADSYLWDFGDGRYSNEQNPIHLYEEIGLYTVSLEVSTINGCTDRHEKPSAVTVLTEGAIVFPNAFKPNMSGPSGGYFNQMEAEKNEVFHPRHEGVVNYRLEIYNRWGEKLFESNEVNIGWDGYSKGQLVSQGVYIWKVSGNYQNGQPFSIAGDVTLLHEPDLY